MPPYFETVKVSRVATVMNRSPFFSSPKLYESLRSMINLFIQVFCRCSINGIWSRDAIFFGSFRWIGTDVRYAHLPLFLKFQLLYNMDGYEYHRSEESMMSFVRFLITIVVFFFLSKICLILRFLDLSSRISEAISPYVFAFLLCLNSSLCPHFFKFLGRLLSLPSHK